MNRSTESCTNLVDLLRQRADQQSERKAFTFLVDGDEEGAAYTYAGLDRRSRAVAAYLQAQGVGPGERALLLFPPGLDFLTAFLGCLYAGVIAIPAPPPDAARMKRSLPRLRSIVEDARATVVLTTEVIARLAERMGDRVEALGQVRWVDVADITDDRAETWRALTPAPDDVAYLQYTSGSTAAAKGVMISHGNVMGNCAYMRRRWGYGQDSVACTWMPYFHDYGLVEGLLQPIYSAVPSYLLSPLAFLRRPLRWLHAISRYGVTHSAAPNFGYDHCVERATAAKCVGLDLSRWRIASTGAEVIRDTTLERFAETFAAYGFDPSAFFPSYGLAEATLMVTTKNEPASAPTMLNVQTRALERGWVVEAPKDPGSGPPARTVVGCGGVDAEAGVDLIVVHPETGRRCSPDEVGEIWVSAPFIAQGYWGHGERNEAVFRAQPGAGQGSEADQRGYLRTGDLGFLRTGDLFVTGRLKEVIIIRGCNHFPQDIERSVEESHALFRENGCAAFSVEVDGDERLIVAVEVEREYDPGQLDELAATVRRAVIEGHELQVYGIELLRRGSLPKTSSGKVQRRACRAAYLEGRLESVGSAGVSPEILAAPPEMHFETGDPLPGPPKEFATLVELLRHRARTAPDKVGYLYLEDGEREGASYRYGELDERARAIGALLQGLTHAGDRVLLLYPAGLDFVSAFFGCLYAGAVAVPTPPPEANRLGRTLPRLEGIVRDAEPTVVLTTSEVLKVVGNFFTHTALESMRWIATDEVSEQYARRWRDPRINPGMLAFLQYTSGSTSQPKGVMVSHRKLVRHAALVNEAWNYDAESVSVSWMPNFHDFGLIEGLLHPLYQGIPVVVMSPLDLIKRPIRWLRAISRYRATHSGGPNFSYELCLRKTTAAEREGLDLSSWRAACNGAEPVQPSTLDRFTAMFAPHGFRRETFYPAYGLAEATLVVTAAGRDPREPLLIHAEVQALEQGRIVEQPEPGPHTRTLVGCGRPVLDTKVVIVDPQSHQRCAADVVGEIWVSSHTLPRGYWRNAEATGETFQAYLKDTGEGPFLRTGDLGFLRHGELFISSRLKDLMIIRGVNHYPQDVEWTVQHCHEALRPGCIAAFSVAGDEEDGVQDERLVIVAEVVGKALPNGDQPPQEPVDFDDLYLTIREAVTESHGVEVYAIDLLKPREIPKTSSGKIPRAECKRLFLEGQDVVGRWSRTIDAIRHRSGEHAILPPDSDALGDEPGRGVATVASIPEATAAATAAVVAEWLTAKVADRLGIPVTEVDPSQPFSRFGLDSASSVSLVGELEDWLGQELPTTLLYNHPTIDAVSRYLGGYRPAADGREERSRGDQNEPIAVIGVGCRFPGADGPEAFWQLLADGVDAVREVPTERWDAAALYAAAGEETTGKMTTRWGGFLDGVDRFDPQFFAISPREAPSIDPQQRLLMEVGWEALEDAGVVPETLAGSATGVFVGISTMDYGQLQLNQPRERLTAHAGTGSALSIAANRLSFLFDLRGPSLAVDTACSSSLVGVHMACRSLASGETDMALAAGVNLMLLPQWTITFSQAQMMAADGRCKTFDAAADGYVRGEGCGAVVLKRLSDARRDGDRVLGVIAGSALNQDGRSNGLTAPNGEAQRAVIERALANAGVTPGEVDYVEAHGTGTRLGDPIEVTALAAALGEGRAADRPLVIGSAKTNIGHLESAAGMAGLIKVLLALDRQEIPPHLHFHNPSPEIPWDRLPVTVPTTRRPWPRGDKRRVAGISSFGFGGTNSHVVVADPPPLPESAVPAAAPAATARPAELVLLSARSEAALRRLAGRHGAYLTAHPETDLLAFTHTLNTRRTLFPYRLAAVAGSTAELAERLTAYGAGQDPATLGGLVAARAERQAPAVGFLLTGQGAQAPGMTRGLYDTAPVFRRALDQAAKSLEGKLSAPLLSVLFPEDPEDATAAALLADTAFTQPALFAVETALAALWRSWGVEPAALLGHSVGEYAAAALAGVFSPEAGLQLITRRGRLMAGLPTGGTMAAVFAPEAAVRRAIEASGEDVSIAAINGPASTAVSGPVAAVERLRGRLEEAGVESRPMQVSHAFHSDLLEPMLDDLQAAADQVSAAPPRVPLISNLTGQVIPGGADGEAPLGAYWRRHARQPVRFADGVAALRETGCTVVLEVGPHPTLIGLARRCPDTEAISWVPSLRRGHDDWRTVLAALGTLAAHGVAVDWDGFYGDVTGTIPRLALPTYPFERQRYWLEAMPVAAPVVAPAATPVLPSAPSELPVSDDTGSPDGDPGGDATLRGYYKEISQRASYEGEEEIESYLHFTPFPEVDPEFSWVLTLTNPERYAHFTRVMDERNAEMRAVMFRGLAMEKVGRVLDFGCGYGSDLIDLAKQHGHLRLDGFNISTEQVEIARRRAERMGFADRLAFHNKDSTRDEFPGTYDVILGSQVLHHIPDKDAVFANVDRHLRPGGALVLAEVISALETSIDAPESTAYFAPRPEWAEKMARHGLRIVNCVDVSQEIANFLDDPHFAEHLEQVAEPDDKVTREHLEGPHQLGFLLRKRLALYCLFSVQRDELADEATLLRHNRRALQELVPYATAVAWLRGEEGEAPASATAVADAAPAARSDVPVGDFLAAEAARILALPGGAADLDIHAPLSQLGLDSLMALELKKSIEQTLGVQVPVVRFLEGDGVKQLTEFVEGALGGAAADGAEGGVAPVAPVAAVAAVADEALAAQVGEMSDAEVEALLSEVLAQEDLGS